MGLFRKQNYKAVKPNGQFLFSDFSYGLYSLETPRGLGEQLASLAMVGGRNVWTEKGALTTQYGYFAKGQMDEGDIPRIVSSDNETSNNIFFITDSNKVYHYTTYEGLKKYKTVMTGLNNPIIAHNGKSIFVVDGEDKYIYGDVYNADTDTDVPYKAITTSRLPVESFSSSFKLLVTAEEREYLWLDKYLVVDIPSLDSDPNLSRYQTIFVNSISPYNEVEGYDYMVEFYFESYSGAIAENVTVGEKTFHTLGSDEFKWIPEQGSLSDIAEKDLEPKLMAVCLNRLWVVDKDNTIFYSAVGNMTSFNEANGAGYFKGFYNDSSEILSLEEYFSGVLITKKTGMFHVKLTTKEYSWGEIATGTTNNYISINKINNIGQEYPGDHVIINDEIIAYDSNSGNLVQACYINYFGNPQQGGVLLHGSELSSQTLGIYNAENRVLAYSFQEECLLFYYGSNLQKSLLINRGLAIYPREIDQTLLDVEMFAQGFICLTRDGLVIEDFKRGTTIPNLTAVAEFEPIALRSNKLFCGGILEFTELDGTPFNVTTFNAGTASQDLKPSIHQISDTADLSNLIYSDRAIQFITESYAEKTRWASQKSSVTRLYSPLGGRDGLGIRLEFPVNQTFSLSAINIPDASQGE